MIHQKTSFIEWPARNRSVDYFIMAFYAGAFMVIYLLEIEQLVIADPENFDYPVWPPRKLVDLIQWWGLNYHGGLWARPAWYRATIWVDVFFSGPVYIAGIYAFYLKKAWIKYPAILQSFILIIIVFISAYEEIWGVYAGDQKVIVLTSMLLWMLGPMIVIMRCMQMGYQLEK